MTDSFTRISLLWLLLCGLLEAAPEFPALSGRVVDQAGLLATATVSALTSRLEQHEQTTSNQIVVVTLNSLQGYDIADYGYQLGRHWGIGQAGRDNGALLIVAPNERKMRIEVGYGLEGWLTDAISSDIVRNKIRPAFKAGNYDAGVSAGVDAMLAAVAGSYTVTPGGKKTGASNQVEGAIFPLVFLGFIFLSEFSRGRRGTHILRAIIPAGIVGTIAWIITGMIIIGVIAALVVFILSMMSGRGGGGGSGTGRRSNRSSRNDTWGSGTWGGGGFGGGGFGGGGFGGGGGGFGGGGASGGW